MGVVMTAHRHAYDFTNLRNRIYVGMFQSLMGIYVIDADTNKIVHNLSFKTNEHNKYSKWVDPLSQEIYKNAILSVNRNNCELAIIKADSFELIKTIFLGFAPNGPRDIVVFRDEAIISYPERNGAVSFLKLTKFYNNIDKCEYRVTKSGIENLINFVKIGVKIGY